MVGAWAAVLGLAGARARRRAGALLGARLQSAALAPGVARAVRFSARPASTGRPVALVGLDHPARRLRLTAGRLPRACTAAGCEVVTLNGRLPAAFSVDRLHLRVVGAARLSGVPLGPIPPPPGSIDATAAFVATRGVGPVAGLRALRGVPRTFAWARRLDPARVHPWSAGALIGELEDARSRLESTWPTADVTLPDGPVAAEQRRGRAAAAFAVVVAGLAATVLLAFAAFAAAERAEDVGAELDRLRAMAARRRHLALLVLTEAALPAAAGVLAGVLLAAALALAAAARAGVPAGPILRAGLLTGDGLALALGCWAAAAALVAGVLAGAHSRAVRIALEAACAVALAATAWQAAARGRVDAGTLAAGAPADPVLVLAPGAIALGCGLLALRTVPALLRAVARAAGRLPVGPYLTLVALARRPARTAAAVTVVAVAGAAGTFALAHARALERSERDQAAYRTAADVRVLAAVPGPVSAATTPVIRTRAETLGRLTSLQLRVVGTVAHVPTTGSGQAAVADVGRLYAALNSLYPGLGSVSERWTDHSRDGASALRLSDLLRAARADPLARGVLLGLRVLALLAGLAALAAVCLAVASSARDRGGEQAELEALGIPPRTLRAQMVATAAATAVAGLLAGLAGGAALASAFARLVALGADGRRPLPDLLAAYPWPLAAALALAVAGAAALAAGWQGRRAFRGAALGRLRG